MKKFILPVLASLVFLAGCKDSKKQAIEFNNKLSAISDSLYSRGKVVGGEINKAIMSKDFSSVATAGKGLESFVVEKISAVKAMDNVAGSEDLKAAMLDFLEYEIKISRDAFMPFGNLTATSSDDEVQAVIKNLMDKSKDEATYMQKLKTAQQDYAKKNKFEVVEKAKM